MKIMFAILSLCALAGCSITGPNACAAIDAAHDVFLAEVEADPTAYTPKQQRNERLSYAAAKIACSSFVRASPTAE